MPHTGEYGQAHRPPFATVFLAKIIQESSTTDGSIPDASFTSDSRLKSLNLTHGLHLPNDKAMFPQFTNCPGMVSVDKTSCALALPSHFRYILLRPRRFGKSAFLSTLHHLYDIQSAEYSITSMPLRKQHLCIRFAIPARLPDSIDLATVTKCLRRAVVCDIQQFRRRYREELQIDPGDLRDKHTRPSEQLLAELIAIVRSRKLTLFVAVDDFDAPFRPIDDMWAGKRPAQHVPASGRDIAQAMETQLWAPLRAGYDVIAKLVVSGCLLPDASLIHLMELTVAPELVPACGFTISEAHKFASAILGDKMGRECVEAIQDVYSFDAASKSESVLHPQQVINAIRRKSQRDDLVHGNPDRSFDALSAALGAIATSCGDAILNVDSLIDLVASLGVHAPSPMQESDFVDLNFERPTWAMLLHLGALTRDPHCPATLLLRDSPQVLHLIHARIDAVVAERYPLRWNLRLPWSDFLDFRPAPLGAFMEAVLRNQSLRSISTGQREPDLRGIFELIARNKDALPSADFHHPPCFVPSPFSSTSGLAGQTFVTPKNFSSLHVQLITLTLAGLWRGQHPNELDRKPSRAELGCLFEDIIGANEENLLQRPYREESSMAVVVVGNVLSSDPEHTQFIAVGGARILYRTPLSTQVDNSQYFTDQY
ncbi:AAA-ATPase-like domain-containing protein [Mycena kentingensis (nom. inval.)]|nr:AAA-ATPase-like domain-containing protein [Mycena kentingensis (nom. inval.)]